MPPATVLIVDDDAVIAEMTCAAVQLAGAVAVYRTGVVDAIDYLARSGGEVVAVLTDIDLASPMSGVELAVHVAAEWPGIAICAVSGVVPERPRRLPDKAGFIAKPWRSPEIEAFVRAALGR